MSTFENTASRWIDAEDEACREDRIQRLVWMATNFPSASHLTFPGGVETKYLYEEARYCYAYGQFLATTTLSIAFVERVLAALLFASGRDDLKRASIAQLAQEARNAGLITDDELDKLEQLRKVRNPLVHFREPGNRESLEIRSLIEFSYGEIQNFPLHHSELIAYDAKFALQTLFHFLGKFCASEDTE